MHISYVHALSRLVATLVSHFLSDPTRLFVVSCELDGIVEKPRRAKSGGPNGNFTRRFVVSKKKKHNGTRFVMRMSARRKVLEPFTKAVRIFLEYEKNDRRLTSQNACQARRKKAVIAVISYSLEIV